MQKIIAIAATLTLCSALSAQRPNLVRATPNPIELTQPNGDKITTRLHGDERGHFRTTLDGYRIEQNADGYFCYAKKNKQGLFEPTKRIAKNEAQRSQCDTRFLKKNGLK